jgi:soluble cytochrome b562
VLAAIAEALDERLLERAVEKAAAKVNRRRRAVPERRAQVERDLADVGARLQRGLDALLAGTDAADELRARLKIEKARKAALTAELEGLRKAAAAASSTTRASCRSYARATFGRCWGKERTPIPRTRQDPPQAARAALGVPYVRRGRPLWVSLHRAGLLCGAAAPEAFQL